MKCDEICAGDDPPPSGSNPNDPDASTARTDPRNETGQPGVDLGSRNFNWSAPILSLPGRAGLNVDLALYYNSLVWTREGSVIRFNADRGFPGPAPGFNLGLPRVQQRYINQAYGGYAYLLVTPSGGDIELRQVGTSNVYESADSSYLQLVDYDGTKIVRSTDGTEFTFMADMLGEFTCRQIKDRNGNCITATYNDKGDIASINDTLGRNVTFNYDGFNYLLSITTEGHTWATFGYASIFVQANFNATVEGPNNQNIPVLSSITLTDGSSYNFDYTSWGQIFQIRQNAADGHMRSQTTYNLPQDSSSAYSDCPRFTQRYETAENSTDTTTTYVVGGDWTQVTQPDGTTYREFFGSSGWQKGLTIRTEFYDAASNLKKWTTTDWTQDDTNLSYQKNPRVAETNTYDDIGNRRRTTIDYSPPQYAQFGLPYFVSEYAADGATELRRTYTDYNLSQTYIDHRIIGLVSATHIYNPITGEWLAKTTYGYDDPSRIQAQATSAQNHDASYDQSYLSRGNVTSVSRWDVTDINNPSKALTSVMSYNAAGSMITSTDPAGHQNSVDYTDWFSEEIPVGATFAYPTSTTDGDGYSSHVRYNYDLGTASLVQSKKGATTVLSYDAIGRRSRVSYGTGAYTRWVYPQGQTYVETFSYIVDGAPESYSMTVFDGVGRTIDQLASFSGSSGGYKAQAFSYDSMGRLAYQSNPTEVNNAWTPVGDDATAGWQWTHLEYDYKGRPTRTTNADGTTQAATYGGCGCAGGDTVTVRDEANRQRRTYHDVLGRQNRVDELNWDGSIYATTTFAYNARDQITQIVQAGDRVRSFGYDGYGRLVNRTTPEQGTTTYSYLADDTVQTITDARGASQSFTYNGRHLPTNLTYGVPAGVAATANVTFLYDEAGNRTWMADGYGSSSYTYDTYSRMTNEWRYINDLGNWYGLSYDYTIGGSLSGVTNPWGVRVGYNFNPDGELTNATAGGYQGVSNYVNSISYRASGAAKQVDYGNSRSLFAAYDNRMRLTTWDVNGVTGYDYNYDYFNNHTTRVSYAHNRYDSTLDRSYEYDHVGRLIISHSGAEARAAAFTGDWSTMDGPFSLGFEYDAWGDMTRRYGWGGEVQGGGPGQTSEILYSYTNNRRNGFGYDAAGNLTNDLGQTFTYDAGGSQTYASYMSVWQGHDGDGLRVKKTENGAITYYIHSVILGGQVVAEIGDLGGGNYGWTRGYVYTGAQLTAIQENGTVYWAHQDPINKSQRISDTVGNAVASIELDPWGGDTNRSGNSWYQPKRFTSYHHDANGSDEALARRYNRWHSRFDQPDPYEGSYDISDPQSFNRYAYVQNDPVNFIDPTGLDSCHTDPATGQTVCIPDITATVTVRAGGDGGSSTGPSIIGDEDFRIVEELGGDQGGSDGGGAVGSDPAAQQKGKGFLQDPNSDFCKSLLEKISNIRRDIVEHIDEFMRNPRNLELVAQGTYRLRDDGFGHLKRIMDEHDNFQRRIDEYTNRCGGPPPGIPISRSPVAGRGPSMQARRPDPTFNRDAAGKAAAAAGGAVIIYFVVRESLRVLFPPSNLVPVP